ncbi:MAG: transglutaminase-like domain-containing protein [Chloroflexota bacterium]
MISRLIHKLNQWFNWYQLLAFGLFLIVISIMADVVVGLDRGLQIYSLRTIVGLAAVFSILLSLVERPRRFYLVFGSIFLGIIVSFWIVGDLAQPVFEFLRTAGDYLKSAWLHFFNQMERLPARSLWQEKWGALARAVAVLIDRLREWSSGLPEPVYDPVSLNMVWGLTVWLATIWLYRYLVKYKKAFIGILPVLAIIAGVFRTVDRGMYSLFWVLGFGLLLEVLSNHSQMEDYWHDQRISFSLLIRNRTAKNAVVLSLALVFFAGMISSPRLEEFIDDLKQPQESGSLSSDGERSGKSEAEIVSGTAPSELMSDVSFGRFPNTHLVGSGPELAETRIMYVEIDDQNAQDGDRHYLRSASYATYTLHGWLTADKGFILNQPWDVSEVDYTENEKLIYQEVILLDGNDQGNLMYSVGELAAANVPYFTSYHTKFINDTYLDVFAAVTSETQYSAYSIVPNFGVSELRSSPLNYPAWIRSKYLQVPDEVPDRVYELALRLTATQPTAFDRALAIEDYLHQFEYTLDLEDPPRYHDLTDYFLFDLQKGYCDYFATSMVVLARAAGLPARFATGYVASTYNEASGRYIVTADQAHAWAEVYFAGYGWVTFEPTPGRPQPERLEEREILSEQAAIDLDFDQPDSVIERTIRSVLPDNLFILLSQLALLVTVAILAVHWIDLSLLRLIAPNKMYARIYRRLRKLAAGIGVKTNLADTPLEFSKLNKNFLDRVKPIEMFSGVFKSAGDNAKFIITACSYAAYANEPPAKEYASQVVSKWGCLRWQYLTVRFYLRLLPLGYSIRRVWRRLQQPA